MPALLGPAVGAFVGNITGSFLESGVDPSFVGEVQTLVKPGSVVLFARGAAKDDARVLPRLQGLGGKVL